jgi:hypothetical protein
MRSNVMYATILALLLLPFGARAGTISGKVKVDGPTPKRKVIDMSKEEACAKDYQADDLPRTENVITGPANTLANVVVYISEGANDEGSVPSQGVTLDQHGCRYVQHITALHVNQKMEVQNSDPVLHNVHPLAQSNREWNLSQPPGSRPMDVKFDQAEFIPVKCNVHPWMHGYIVVLKTNHFAVTDTSGGFSLKGLAPGKYTVTAWHETLGTQQQQVTIGGPNETKTLSFSFKGSGE